MLELLPFFLLSVTLVSLWISKDPKIWGSLLLLTLLSALYTKALLPIALVSTAGWLLLWLLYLKQKKFNARIALFLVIVIYSFGLKFLLFPGYNPYYVTPNFRLGLAAPLIGLFPLALLVPLTLNMKNWFKGFWVTCLGIALLALIVVLSGTIHLQLKLPSFPVLRYSSNLFLTAIPEEGFYRGFVQREIARYFNDSKKGKWVALLVSSLVFTFAHLYWAPDAAMFLFVFFAGLLYGGVYLYTGKIETSIICHFLLNFMHMTFFQYHRL